MKVIKGLLKIQSKNKRQYQHQVIDFITKHFYLSLFVCSYKTKCYSDIHILKLFSTSFMEFSIFVALTLDIG